jgi:hypothetical protein
MEYDFGRRKERRSKGRRILLPPALPVYDGAKFGFVRRTFMQQYALVAIWCVILITGILVYAPIVYIRKTDKVLKVLEQIEINTRKQ